MAHTAFAAPVALRLHPPHVAHSSRRGSRTAPVALLPGGNDSGFGRLNEWASSDGDRGVQDGLASELMRATRHANSARVMDERIADGMAGVTELLAELYLRTERELEEQHADLARRESLPHVSKWNRALIDSHKESKRARVEISAELAEVQYLLKHTKRSRPSASPGAATHARDRCRIPSTIFTAGVTALVLGSFENVAVRQNGPIHLAQFGSVSLLLVLIGAHFHAVNALERGGSRFACVIDKSICVRYLLILPRGVPIFVPKGGTTVRIY